jgi:tetratricopeptide (TPR) repeat protein
MVVTGRDRGRVWSFTASGSPQLRPVGADLLEWYIDELEHGLAPLQAAAEAREQLERRVAVDPEDVEATLALGRELLLVDRDRARDLLERAWRSTDHSRSDLRRAIAELDLIDGRSDRIDSIRAMADHDDDWLRTYAGLAAARAGRHEQAIERLEAARIPALLRSAAIGHLARAHAALGRPEQAIALLRATQASASNHAIAAELRSSIGDREGARRSWAEALAAQDRSRTGPRPPRLADLLEVPVPDPAMIEAAIRSLG